VNDTVPMESTAGQLGELGYGGGVRLTDTRLADRLADAAQTYAGLPIDNVLKGFRERAGLPAPGTGLGGWSRETTEPTFGQWVSGLARLSRVLGEPALAARAVDLIEGYAATLPTSGRTGMGIYGWEKLVCGLVDTAVYADYRPALDLLSKIVRAESFDETRRVPSANDFAGAGPAFTPEWYTLPENLYRGFLAGGDEYLAEFASRWHYDAYWDRFASRPAPGQPWRVPVWLHAYSHVNTLASAGAVHTISGDARYLEILRNAHDWMTQTQCYATGGYGPCELTVPADGTLGRALERRSDTAEIVCGTWAVFKLCTKLVTETGEPGYLRWPENLLYNGLGAATPVRPSGSSPYYADYRLGWARKLPYWEEWPCCSGTYVQAVAHIPDLIYHAAADGITVSLFVSSTVTWQAGETAVTLDQRSELPEGDESVLRVTTQQPVELTIRIRVPGWADSVSVEVNGSPTAQTSRPDPLATAQPTGQPGPQPEQWLAIRRIWDSGDTVRLRFGRSLRAVPVDAFHPNRVAMTYGPVVLAQDASWAAPFTAPVPWEMDEWDKFLVRRHDGLVFDPVAPGTARMPTGSFRPLYDIKEGYPYRVYNDVDMTSII
jgi:uncharacterized protein